MVGRSITALVSILAVGLMAAGAADAGIRIKCEQRADRSKISVDAKDLTPGAYQAQAMSGTNTATSDLANSVGDEVEADFNSDPDNIAQGAVSIPANFIQGGQVTGKILDADGATVISDTVNCRVR